MKTTLRCLLVAGSTIALLLFFGCGVETNQARALAAKHNSSIRRLLVSLEFYKNNNGAFPATLDELRKNDTNIRDIDISSYNYKTNGITVADGTRWLLVVSNPLHTNQVIVGRLPFEVANRTPQEK